MSDKSCCLCKEEITMKCYAETKYGPACLKCVADLAYKDPLPMGKQLGVSERVCECKGDWGLFTWRGDPEWWSCVGVATGGSGLRRRPN